MKCFIGLGSNLGSRLENLERAAQALKTCSENHHLRISPVYKTPAMVPPGSPANWNISYLNAVAEIKWVDSANTLLLQLKKIEQELGRTEKAKWAPRQIDLDLIAFGQEVIQEASLQVPHPGSSSRSFVLDPLKDLAPGLILPQNDLPVVIQARGQSNRQALIMGILNLTPDSFSDGGEENSLAAFEIKIKKMNSLGVQVLDLGAESTRPGASPVSAEEEWLRLKPALQYLQNFYQDKLLRPLISIDTHKAAVAERALELGADWINDVSGGSDPGMFELFKAYPRCHFVLMHSLSVPADPSVILSSEQDPVLELKSWLEQKLKILDRHDIDANRMIFDPGIGFGKNAAQSIAILKRAHEFRDLPCRLLVGHSRKSLMKSWGFENTLQRDAATLGVSMELVTKGVDILRVHDFERHVIALQSRNEVLS